MMVSIVLMPHNTVTYLEVSGNELYSKHMYLYM